MEISTDQAPFIYEFMYFCSTKIIYMEAFTISTTDLILLSVTGGLFIIQLIYYPGLYDRIRRHNKRTRLGLGNYNDTLEPISVVICARNESENLRRFLPAILEQDYPQFEVIVINDGSTDESEEVLTLFEEKYPHLYHSFTPDSARYISRKKLALTLGIKASKYDWLVFTEANCRPASNQWLRLMAREFTPRTQVVLGYSGYEAGKGWLNKRTSFDTLFTSMRYLGFALAGSPYMGLGRNMAYRKELFFDNKGYSAHLNLQRGEDDLFINQVANGENTRVLTHAQAVTRMQPLERYKDFKEDKVSYKATSPYYKGAQRYVLGFETCSRLLFYLFVVLTIAWGIYTHHWLAAGISLLIWIFRLVVQGVIINKTAAELGESRRYFFSLPVFDLLQPLQSLKFSLYRKVRGRGDFTRK